MAMERADVMRSFNVRAALAGLAAIGLDVAAIREAAGIPPEVDTDPDLFVPNESIAMMWLAAGSQYDRPHLGLAAGRAVPFGAYEVIDYLVSSAPSIGEGMVEMARYFALIHTGITFDIRDAGEAVVVDLQMDKPIASLPPIPIEFTWAVVVTRFREVGNRAFMPAELSLPYTPMDASAFDFVAKRTVMRPDASQLTVGRAMWELPHERRDDRLRSVLERHARDLFEALPAAESSLLGDVKRAIATELRGGNPSIETVAPCLGMSARTLQRRLKDEGHAYQQIVDDVREGLARGYLRSSRLTIAEVAYMLGYSEPSAFNRAFKRWTGTTPSRFRGGS